MKSVCKCTDASLCGADLVFQIVKDVPKVSDERPYRHADASAPSSTRWNTFAAPREGFGDEYVGNDVENTPAEFCPTTMTTPSMATLRPNLAS